MNKYQILVFSPTGNTSYLANILKEKLDCNIIYEDHLIDCEHLIIMSSIHAFKVPLFLKSQIKNIKKLSVIAVGCTTGSINQAAGYHLIKKAQKEKIEIGVYKILAMPLTIVKKFPQEYGEKIIKESIEEIELIANNIRKNINTNVKIPLHIRIISNVHYIESLFVRLFGLELYANKQCIKCGLCIKTCSKKNITLKKKIKFKFKCMMCMKCIYSCPKKAIHPRISKFIELKEGYNINEYTKKE